MLVLTLLGLIHVACSNDITSYVDVVKPIADFDEVDAFDEMKDEGHYETISPMELKRLPRKVDAVLEHRIHGLDAEVPMAQNGRNFLNAVGFDEVKNKVQSMSRGLMRPNLKKVDASLSAKNSVLGSKDDFGGKNLFRSPTSSADINVSFKIIATPYTRSTWEPNFLRTDKE